MSETNIHPTAIIAPDAKIDPSTHIGPYTVIGSHVTIGKNNHIGPFCLIENTVMGDDNELIAHATIGVKPQDLSYDNAMQSMVHIGNGNKIRECVTIHRATNTEHPTTVGNNCLLMANSHVAHDCCLGSNIIVANSTGIAGHAQIADRVVCSGLVGIHQFVRIGRMCMISGGALVRQDVPPFCIVEGGRPKLIGLNVIGLRRNGLSHEQITQLNRAFKTLFRSKMLLKDAIAKVEAENKSDPFVQELVDFCKESKRGITAAVQAKHHASAD